MYGIWNDVTKRFAFGISEPTKHMALQKFKEINPVLWRYWRYEVRLIPLGWVNPPNTNYKKEK